MLLRAIRPPASRRKGQSGTAAIEFALMAPFLALLAVGAVEIGTAAFRAMQAQNAAEAGAIYASKNGFDVDGISNAVRNAVGSVTINPAPGPSLFCGCPVGSGVTPTADCATNCADGTAPGQYVQISAQIASPPWTGFPLGLPTSFTRTATVRLY